MRLTKCCSRRCVGNWKQHNSGLVWHLLPTIPTRFRSRDDTRHTLSTRSQVTMRPSAVPNIRDLVLLGGGHSHVELLRSLGMQPLEGVQVTLVTRDVHTPYSGMLPGYVSGFYTYDDCHIDLSLLATFANARLIHAEASNLDIKGRQVQFPDRPPIAYDVLSINIGITPGRSTTPGAEKYSTPVKPIDRFVARFEVLLQRFFSWRRGRFRVAVVGGGAGGVELALAVKHRLEEEKRTRGMSEQDAQPHVTLFSRGGILEGYPSSTRAAARRIAAQRGVMLVEGDGVTEVREDELQLASGAVHEFEECLWCTQASAAQWLEATGLPTDPQGFIKINDFLQSDEGPQEVFAVGDVSSSTKHPRPKAGVFAVRQGVALADNMRRYLSGQPMQPFVPQSTFLSLISAGDKYALGCKGWLAFEGAWAWTLKDNIDRAFMDKYGRMVRERMAQMAGGPAPGAREAAATPAAVSAAGPEALAALAAAKMRCGGCGSKVGSSILARAMARLPPQEPRAEVVVGLDSPDDAALVRPPPPGFLLVQTVDFFRAITSDPYVFGMVAANHALGDIHAMGAEPVTALAVAVVPFAGNRQMEEELVQLMAGALRALQDAGCTLVGGHSAEGPELALGLTINGQVREGQHLSKGGLVQGQALMLTKAIGTGVIMAAAMRGLTKGRCVGAALQAMRQGSGEAAACLRRHGATACTDVTGFGLLGHLVEMLRASKVHARLELSRVPLLDGALEASQAGAFSSLHSQNAVAAASVANAESVIAQPTWPLLLDPQTAGGLLAGIPQEQAEACVEELHRLGYSHAAVVGSVEDPNGPGGQPVRVV